MLGDHKIDLPKRGTDRVISEIEDVIGLEAEDAPRISKSQGLNNIEDALEQIVEKTSCRKGNRMSVKSLILIIMDSYKQAYCILQADDGCIVKRHRSKNDGNRFFNRGCVGWILVRLFISCDELSAEMVVTYSKHQKRQ